uniref:Candidate secreted effector n=1 Tax=Meloidogyne incognita TaxID=6306 RepID=A0A914LA59_MELIC
MTFIIRSTVRFFDEKIVGFCLIVNIITVINFDMRINYCDQRSQVKYFFPSVCSISSQRTSTGMSCSSKEECTPTTGGSGKTPVN